MPIQPLAAAMERLAAPSAHSQNAIPIWPPRSCASRLEDQADASTGRLVGGKNQNGGAMFAKNIAGTRAQEANLHAAVGALPNGEAARSVIDDVLATMRATGYRKVQGSATSFNQEYREAMSDPGVVTGAMAAAKSGGLSIPIDVLDRAKRATMGRRVETLADLFTHPEAIGQIRKMAARASGMSPVVEMLARQAMQTPTEVR